MYVRVLKSHHHFFCGLPYLTTQEEVWLRACNNDVQYTLKAYTLIFTWVRVEFFFFFFQENQGKGNKQDLLTWITLSWSTCYKTDCLWCHWKLQNEVFFWRQAGLLDEISVQVARISEICPAHLLVKTHYKFYEETRHELSSWTRLAHLIDTFWYFNGISSY